MICEVKVNVSIFINNPIKVVSEARDYMLLFLRLCLAYNSIPVLSVYRWGAKI